MSSSQAIDPTPSPAGSPEAMASQQAQMQTLEMTPQWQMKNFMALKDKIIHTNQLIQRYQEKARDGDASKKQLREAQSKLATLEQGMVGLRAELHQLHEENGRVTKELMAVQQALEQSNNQKAVQELLAKQLTLEIKELRFVKEDSTDYNILRRERNGYKDEKERAQRQYRQLKKDFEAYKRAHPPSDAKPRVRRRRDSTASSVSCSSLATLVSPSYQPVLINSVVESGVNSPASTIITIQSGYASPTLTPPTGKALQNDLASIELMELEPPGPAWPSDATPVPLTAAPLPLEGSQSSASLPGEPLTNTSITLPEEKDNAMQAEATTPPKPNLNSAAEATNSTISKSSVVVPASTHPLLVARETWEGDSLSCSDTSSECSDSSLDDMLAELLNTSPPLTETASAQEGVKTQPLDVPNLGVCAPVANHPDEVSITSLLQSDHPSATDMSEPLPAVNLAAKQPCASMPALVPHSYPAKQRRRHRSRRHSHKHQGQVGKSHNSLSSGSKHGDDSVPILVNGPSEPLQLEPATCADGDLLKETVSLDVREEILNVLDHSTPVLSGLPTAAASSPPHTEEGVTCSASQPSREDESNLVDLSDAMAQMEWDSDSILPCVITNGQLSEAVDDPVHQPLLLAPPPCPTPPQITVELSHTPDHVSAEADTASSEDSDSDMSISEMEHSLSPLPLSPHAHLQTLSPLPPSPQSRRRTDTISPLPPSPFYANSRNISTPLSPLPPSPCNATLSPLPQSPIHPRQQPHQETDTQTPNAFSATPPILPPLQFIASVPPGLHTPKPCSGLSPGPSPGLSPSKPKGRGRQLCLSESSLFSPPCVSSRRGSAPLFFLAESGGQQTAVATAVEEKDARTPLNECNPPLEQEPSEEGEIVDSEDETTDTGLSQLQPEETPDEAPPLSENPLQPLPALTDVPADGGRAGDKAKVGKLEEGEVEEKTATCSPLPQLQPAQVLTNSPLFTNDKCGRPPRKSSRRRKHKSLGSASDSGSMTSFDRLLQSVSKQPPSQPHSHSDATVRHTSGSPPATMPPANPPCGSPPPNCLEATPSHVLPGYQLRSRKVELWEYFPQKRKTSGSEEPQSESGVAAILRESYMYQLRSRGVELKEDLAGPSRKRKLSVETKTPSNHLVPPEKVQKLTACPNSASSSSKAESQSVGAGPSLPTGNTTEPQIWGGDPSQASIRNEPCVGENPSPAAGLKRIELQPVPSHRSAEHLPAVGVGPSPAGGAELQPVSATMERRRSSRVQQLLQLEEAAQRQNRPAHGAISSLNSDVSSPSLDADAAPPTHEVARRTDGATGQEENPTPLSSPKGWNPTSLSSPKGWNPTSLSSPKSANSSAELEGVNRIESGGGSDSDLHQLISRLPSPVHKPTPPRLQGSSDSALPPSLQQPQLSLAQQQLTVCMQCSLPLPGWLVTAMAKTQSLSQQTPAAISPALKKRKRGSLKEPIHRQHAQNCMDYALLNLERLVCGYLYLSPVITMFSSPRNVPCPSEFSQAVVKFLRERYYPKSEQVVSLYHELCSSVRENRQLSPQDRSFPPPLLKPECQLVALLAHLCRTNSKMTHLLPELTKSLYQAILAPGLKFHTMAAMCRIFTAICRLQGEAERVQYLCCDLLRKPLKPNELPLLVAVASIWPIPLARTPGMRLVERNQLIVPGLEQQAISYTLEVITISMLKAQGEKSQENMLKNFHTLCSWSQSLHPRMFTHLTKVLVGILRDSEQVYIDGEPQDQFPWRRPRPSVVAFRVVHCLRMLAWFLGWVWTNDTLIRAHIWPILQQWHGKKGEAVRESTVICIIRLIGFISQQGLSVDAQSSSILQLQRVLLALLKGQGRKVSLPLQLAAADSLLELCPPGHPSAKEALAAIIGWLQGMAKHPASHTLTQEFHTRLLPFGMLGSK